MTETDLLLKLAKQVEQRRQIVRMLEEEMKNINQVLSDYVFMHKKISLLEIEDDVNDCPSRYLDCVYKLGRRNEYFRAVAGAVAGGDCERLGSETLR